MNLELAREFSLHRRQLMVVTGSNVLASLLQLCEGGVTAECMSLGYGRLTSRCGHTPSTPLSAGDFSLRIACSDLSSRASLRHTLASDRPPPV